MICHRRVRFMAGAILAATALGLGSGVTGAEAPPPVQAAQPRPNILFILVDDMGFADLSAMGNRAAQTPNLDRLANEGLLLTRAYDPAPVCSPSRVGFFTGRFPAALGFVSFLDTRAAQRKAGQPDWLDPKVPNLARLLGQAGYATGHFGKWHMGGGRDVGDAPWPSAYGFDESYTSFEGLGPRALISDHPGTLSKQSAVLGQGPIDWRLKRELTATYIDRLTDFVARRRDQPWFAQLWPDDVHDLHQPGAAALALAQGKGSGEAEQRYFAVLEDFDRQIGRLRETLSQLGELDNTLIVVTSDNGPTARAEFYRGGSTPPGSVGSLRGRKWSLYEGGIRQPMIWWWPGRIAPGRRDERTVAQGIDLLPTLAGIAGTNAPQALDGIDLGPALSGHPIGTRPDLYWTTLSLADGGTISEPFVARDRSPGLAMRSDNWKLLTGHEGRSVELYNMDSDPDERTNLAPCHPRLVRDMGRKLASWWASVRMAK